MLAVVHSDLAQISKLALARTLNLSELSTKGG